MDTEIKKEEQLGAFMNSLKRNNKQIRRESYYNRRWENIKR